MDSSAGAPAAAEPDIRWEDVARWKRFDTAQVTKSSGGCRVDGVETCRGRWTKFLDWHLLPSNFFFNFIASA